MAHTFDLVIANGRVMDPESGLDGVRNVGIRNGKIAAISAATLQGRTTLDATGLVVAPGFIDLHAHGQDDENYRLYAMDGVTTALELEVGNEDVGAWYAAHAGQAPNSRSSCVVLPSSTPSFTPKASLAPWQCPSMKPGATT